MATITIHELDDGVFARISDMARMHRRPVDEEIKELLQRSVEGRLRRQRLVELVDAIAATTVENDDPTEDSLAILRRDRSR